LGDRRGGQPPRVWAILCYRGGDNEQILALAEALGWPFEVKRLAYRPFGRTIDVFRLGTLAGIVRHASDPLVPPWPDLIISSSMRNEPVCRWIQRQAQRPVAYVHIGRPWARLKNFDLIVAQPQYRLRRQENVLETPFCLHRVSDDRLVAAGRQWTSRVECLPRPRIALMVGGSGGPYALDPEGATRLARKASAFANERGGSLLVSTSSRTAPAAAAAVATAISVPTHVHLWRANAPDNPYLAFLALADEIIVTCDSVSMLTEACATRKPVYLYDLGPGKDDERLASRGGHEVPEAFCQRFYLDRFKAFVYRNLVHVPPQRMTRDLGLVHRHFVETGRVVWLGESFPTRLLPPIDDLSTVASRVAGLVERKEGTALAVVAAGSWAASGGACSITCKAS
jgi:mitochondrial fission protein ELM1